MAVIKRHWKLAMSVVVFGIGVCVVLLVLRTTDQPVRADEGGGGQGVALDPVGYGEICDLRERSSLTNESLAAMGFSQATAEAVLGAVGQWYATNRAVLSRQRRAEAVARSNLRGAMRKVNVGPKDDAVARSLSELNRAVTEAASARRRQAAGLIAAVAAKLSASERATYEMIRGNAGVSGLYRYVSGLTAAQRGQLRMAHYRRGQAALSAKTAAARSAVSTSHGNVVGSILSGMQLTEIGVIRQRLARGSAGVAAAEAKVFPVPAALRPQQRPATR